MWRILDDLFETVQQRQQTGDIQEAEIFVSFVEIYNEKVYDLFLENNLESIYNKGSKFNGSSRKPISSRDDAIQLLTEANKNRHVRSTILNSSSSRSHAIFTIHLNVKKSNGILSSSALNLVDLAGSEGLRRTGHKGIALQEGVSINQGLLTLGKVLQALSTGGKVIPYRDSALSVVLQGEFFSNSHKFKL